jgi:hypothetical protein
MWMNSLASSVVVFVANVKVGVVWAAASLIPPFEEPTTRTRPSTNRAAITHGLILVFSVILLLPLFEKKPPARKPTSPRNPLLLT